MFSGILDTCKDSLEKSKSSAQVLTSEFPKGKIGNLILRVLHSLLVGQDESASNKFAQLLKSYNFEEIHAVLLLSFAFHAFAYLTESHQHCFISDFLVEFLQHLMSSKVEAFALFLNSCLLFDFLVEAFFTFLRNLGCSAWSVLEDVLLQAVCTTN